MSTQSIQSQSTIEHPVPGTASSKIQQTSGRIVYRYEPGTRYVQPDQVPFAHPRVEWDKWRMVKVQSSTLVSMGRSANHASFAA